MMDFQVSFSMKNTAIFNFLATVIVILYLSLRGIACDKDHDPLEDKYGKIIHVSAVFRHGDRTPALISYPKDPYINYPWENGIGQLLTKGKHRLFSLGEWLREHYSRLLQSIHSRIDIRIDSSDMDRTIMSAQCLMAGFYPPNESEIFIKGLKWQPIPVHVVPNSNNMINPITNCPAIKHKGNKYFARKEMQKEYDKYEDDFIYLEKNAGLPFRRNRLYEASYNVYFLWDALSIEERENLTLPEWTKKVYPSTIVKLMDTFLFEEMRDLKIQRMMTGRIFESIITDMRKKVHNPKSTSTIHFYSGHEFTLAAILHSLDVFDRFIPPLGAIAVLEVRKKDTEHIVTVRYKKSLTEELEVLHIPKCRTPCTLQNFVNLVKRFIPKNKEAECGAKREK